jgi:hypothetical protein
MPAARSTRFTAMVNEGLRAVAAPDLCDAIVGIALHHARLDAIPTDALDAIEFVDGPLRRGIEQLLGIGAADTVVTQLVALLTRAVESGEHPKVRSRSVTPVTAERPIVPDHRDDTPTVPAPNVEPEPRRAGAPAATPRAVLVLTRDVHMIDAMLDVLHRVAYVFRADDLADLQRRLRAAPTPVVVIDARPADAPSVKTVAASLPRNATLVVWGKNTPRTEGSPAFISCEDTAEPADIAALCANLIGRPH